MLLQRLSHKSQLQASSYPAFIWSYKLHCTSYYISKFSCKEDLSELTFKWTLALIRDLMPTTLCSMKLLVMKLPCDMIESTICKRIWKNVKTLKNVLIVCQDLAASTSNSSAEYLYHYLPMDRLRFSYTSWIKIEEDAWNIIFLKTKVKMQGEDIAFTNLAIINLRWW